MTSLMNKMRSFLRSEDGLVTVEWVAISAAVVVGGIGIAYTVLEGLQAPATAIGTTLAGVPDEVPTTSLAGTGGGSGGD